MIDSKVCVATDGFFAGVFVQNYRGPVLLKKKELTFEPPCIETIIMPLNLMHNVFKHSLMVLFFWLRYLTMAHLVVLRTGATFTSFALKNRCYTSIYKRLGHLRLSKQELLNFKFNDFTIYAFYNEWINKLVSDIL